MKKVRGSHSEERGNRTPEEKGERFLKIFFSKKREIFSEDHFRQRRKGAEGDPHPNVVFVAPLRETMFKNSLHNCAPTRQGCAIPDSIGTVAPSDLPLVQ